MAAVTRRQYKGAAVATTITAGINPSDVTCTLAATTGWPSTASVPFIVVIEPGTSAEEKCSATISGSTLTLIRAQDDTTAASHGSGSTIYPVFSADEADEANLFASTMTTRGDLLTMNSSTTVSRLAVSSNNGYVLTSNGTDPVWGQVANAGVASDAAIALSKLATTGTLTATTFVGALTGTATNATNVAKGIVAALVKSTSDDTSVTTSEELQITATSFTAVADRYYRITYHEPFLYTSTNAMFQLKIRSGTAVIGSTLLNASSVYAQSLGYAGGGTCTHIGTFTAGTVNLIGTLSCSDGTGIADRASTAYAFILVEDIGVL